MADMHDNSKETRSSYYEISIPNMEGEAMKARKVDATLKILERKRRL
jgi:hypothetical protein